MYIYIWYEISTFKGHEEFLLSIIDNSAELKITAYIILLNCRFDRPKREQAKTLLLYRYHPHSPYRESRDPALDEGKMGVKACSVSQKKKTTDLHKGNK